MGSARFVRALGFAFVVMALVSGCGSEVASKSQQPEASPPAQPNYSGLTLHSLLQAGFSIGVPSGWTTLTGEDADRASVDAIVEDEPTLGRHRDLLTMPDTPFKLIALQYDADTCTCSTFSVIAFPLDDSWAAADFEAGGLDGARNLALPGTRPTSQRVKTPVASGVRITTLTTLPGSNMHVVMTQYFIHTRTSSYILSFTASQAAMSTYDRLFVRSARSLRDI
jgi:hypothetical protein